MPLLTAYDVVRVASQAGTSVLASARRTSLDNVRRALDVLDQAIDDRAALAPDGMAEHGHLALLDRDECHRLLASQTVGRLAYVARAGVPDVTPVNYVLDGDDVVIRSGPGPKLQAAQRRETVAFEVDQIDADAHSGWSVVVVGRASVAAARELSVLPEPWSAGPRRHLIRVTPRRITGRRLF